MSNSFLFILKSLTDFDFFSHLMTGSYNNFFKIFDRRSKRDVMYEATKEIASSLSGLKPRKV